MRDLVTYTVVLLIGESTVAFVSSLLAGERPRRGTRRGRRSGYEPSMGTGRRAGGAPEVKRSSAAVVLDATRVGGRRGRDLGDRRAVHRRADRTCASVREPGQVQLSRRLPAHDQVVVVSRLLLESEPGVEPGRLVEVEHRLDRDRALPIVSRSGHLTLVPAPEPLPGVSGRGARVPGRRPGSETNAGTSLRPTS